MGILVLELLLHKPNCMLLVMYKLMPLTLLSLEPVLQVKKKMPVK